MTSLGSINYVDRGIHYFKFCGGYPLLSLIIHVFGKKIRSLTVFARRVAAGSEELNLKHLHCFLGGERVNLHLSL